MENKDKIIEMAKENEGVIRTRQVKRVNISADVLKAMTEEGKLERVFLASP